MSRYTLVRRIVNGQVRWFDKSDPACPPLDAATRSHLVIGDINPYKSVVTGEVIGGRRQHRDHLRAHGLTEVGNEKLAPPKPYQGTDARADVKTAIDMVRSGYNPGPVDVWRDVD